MNPFSNNPPEGETQATQAAPGGAPETPDEEALDRSAGCEACKNTGLEEPDSKESRKCQVCLGSPFGTNEE